MTAGLPLQLWQKQSRKERVRSSSSWVVGHRSSSRAGPPHAQKNRVSGSCMWMADEPVAKQGDRDQGNGVWPQGQELEAGDL